MNTSPELFDLSNSFMQVIAIDTQTSARKLGTRVDGKPFDKATIDAVWEKAKKEFGFYYFRRDVCGSVIAKHEYGKLTRYGWVIDHIIPVSMNGTDDIDNLQALHWENNLCKGDNYPIWTGKPIYPEIA